MFSVIFAFFCYDIFIIITITLKKFSYWWIFTDGYSFEVVSNLLPSSGGIGEENGNSGVLPTNQTGGNVNTAGAGTVSWTSDGSSSSATVFDTKGQAGSVRGEGMVGKNWTEIRNNKYETSVIINRSNEGFGDSIRKLFIYETGVFRFFLIRAGVHLDKWH